MADFPYPLYRNLWLGSKLSEDRSAFGGQSGNNWEHTDTGWRGTIQVASSGAFSLIYTSPAYRVPVESNKPYSWLIPIRNPGSTPFNLSVSTWLERSTSGSEGQSFSAVLQPGETRYVKFEGLQSDSAKDIRFSLYYGTDDPKPVVGTQVELLNGITLVQSETAPDFPFNGDGAKPVEALVRRNATTNPSFEDGKTGWGNNTTYSTASIAPGEGVSSGAALLHVANAEATGFTYLGAPRLYGLTGGQYVAVGAKFKRYSEVAYARFRYIFYNSSGGQTGSPWLTPGATELGGDYSHLTGVAQAPSGTVSVIPYAYIFDGPAGDVAPAEGTGWYVDEWITVAADTKSAAEAAVATYFDGDTPASGSTVYRYAPDGTSLEIEVAQPPEGRTAIWDGPVGSSTSTLWVGDTAYATGVMGIGASTEARLGIVSDVYSRSREKIALELARVDSQLIAGERVELDAAAMTASPVVWHWRQVTGPAVELEPREASMDFIAPDVDEDTPLRIAVYAASEDGRNRSDWHYFDLTIKPPIARFRATEGAFSPVSPKYVGYDRGKREVWNDVIPPSGFSPAPRREVEILDLGILPDDVQFTTGGPPERAAAGGIYVDLETGDIYRNFGAGYNETDDTTAAPRTNAWWVNPATGDILEWIED